MPTIILEKAVADGRGEPKGEVYAYTYKSLTRGEAELRATKALKRDLPNERREAWSLHPEQKPEVAGPEKVEATA